MRRLRDRSGPIRVLHKPQHRHPHNKQQKPKRKKLPMLAKVAVEGLRLREEGSQALANQGNLALTC